MELDRLDSISTVQTPEGINLHLRVAGVWSRSAAWLMDLFIRGVIYLVIAIAADIMGDVGEGLLLLSIFMMEWFYPVLFEVLNKGMTPGKKMFGIQVLNADGTPISWSSSLLRNILRVVDFLPFFYALGFISMLMNKQFQRLGDLAADTVVVYLHQHRWQDIPHAAPIKLNHNLNLKEQQAIIRYAERTMQLSAERLTELAEILNVMDVSENKMSKDKLLSLANGLLGR